MQELDAAADSPSESPFAPVQTPRISILHLMLWTLCSAVSLSLMRAIYGLNDTISSRFATIYDASSVMQGIIAGAVLTGAIVLVSTRVRRGPPMLRQPGHWLLFVTAIFQLISISLVVISVLLLRSSSLMFLGFIYLFPMIAYGFAARRTLVLRWRLLFIALAVVGSVQCISYVLISLSAGDLGYSWVRTLSILHAAGNLLLPAAVLVVAIVDLMAGRRYDWLHWTGVATFVTSASVMLLWMIGAWQISLS